MVVVPGCTPFSSELREATDMRVRVPTHTVLMSRQTDPVQSSLRTWGPRTQRPSCFLLDEDGEGDVVVPAPRPGAGGWSCAPGRLVGVGIALSPVPVFRRDCESPVQPERKEKERWKGGGKF